MCCRLQPSCGWCRDPPKLEMLGRIRLWFRLPDSESPVRGLQVPTASSPLWGCHCCGCGDRDIQPNECIVSHESVRAEPRQVTDKVQAFLAAFQGQTNKYHQRQPKHKAENGQQVRSEKGFTVRPAFAKCLRRPRGVRLHSCYHASALLLTGSHALGSSSKQCDRPAEETSPLGSVFLSPPHCHATRTLPE